MKIVLSLGGSFIFNRKSELKELKSLVKNERNSFIIVCGGGKPCRDYVAFGRALGLPEDTLHEIGIKVTKLNAFMIARYINGRYFDGDLAKPPAGRIIVGAGFRVGNTTDVYAANAAVAVGAKVLFNMSKERGVYDRDPDRFKDAKLIKNVGFDKLYQETRGARVPGMNFIFDPRAARTCEKHGIKIVVTDSFKDIKRYFAGGPVSGTVIG